MAVTVHACPRCGLALFSGQVGSVIGFGCGGCGGVWLDNAASRAVVARVDADASALAQRVDTATADRPTANGALPAPGGCPFCREALARVNHAGVTLDVCGTHGTFFDRGELKRVLTITYLRTNPAPPPMRGALPMTDRGSSSWDDDDTYDSFGAVCSLASLAIDALTSDDD